MTRPALRLLTREQDAQLRRAVIRHLDLTHGRALTPEDREELYQEAWACATEYERAGNELRDLRAFLKTVADRRGRNRIRNRRPELWDPHDYAFELLRDDAPEPEEAVQSRVDGATLWRIAAELSELETTVLELRYHQGLAPKEITAQLQLDRNRFNRVIAGALDKVAATLRRHDEWLEEHRELLAACVAGTASEQQRAAARRLVDSDPKARAMLRQLRETTEAAAAIAPVPSLASGQQTPSLLEHATASLHAAKQWAAGVIGRIGDPTPLAAARPGAAAAALSVCIAAGGGATYCAIEGVPDPVRKRLGFEQRRSEPERAANRERRQRQRERRLEPVRVAQPVRTAQPAATPDPARTASPAPAKPAATAAAPAPAPAPVQREFDAATAAAPAATGARAPAAARQAGPTAAEREFGVP